jgi:hypothetical protein
VTWQWKLLKNVAERQQVHRDEVLERRPFTDKVMP